MWKGCKKLGTPIDRALGIGQSDRVSLPQSKIVGGTIGLNFCEREVPNFPSTDIFMSRPFISFSLLVYGILVRVFSNVTSRSLLQTQEAHARKFWEIRSRFLRRLPRRGNNERSSLSREELLPTRQELRLFIQISRSTFTMI